MWKKAVAAQFKVLEDPRRTTKSKELQETGMLGSTCSTQRNGGRYIHGVCAEQGKEAALGVC
jgi:hypothetical protein